MKTILGPGSAVVLHASRGSNPHLGPSSLPRSSTSPVSPMIMDSPPLPQPAPGVPSHRTLVAAATSPRVYSQDGQGRGGIPECRGHPGKACNTRVRDRYGCRLKGRARHENKNRKQTTTHHPSLCHLMSISCALCWALPQVLSVPHLMEQPPKGRHPRSPGWSVASEVLFNMLCICIIPLNVNDLVRCFS